MMPLREVQMLATGGSPWRAKSLLSVVFTEQPSPPQGPQDLHTHSRVSGSRGARL